MLAWLHAQASWSLIVLRTCVGVSATGAMVSLLGRAKGASVGPRLRRIVGPKFNTHVNDDNGVS